MSRLLGTLFLVVLVGGLLVVSSDALACGDKYLVAGSGARYQDALTGKYAGSILIYTSNGAGAASVLSAPEFQATLQAHGHTSEVVEDWASLVAALAARPYDLVLTDLSDASEIRDEIASVSPKTLVVPVMHDAPRKEVKMAKKEYRYLLRTPARVSHLALIIDVAMARKAKS